MSLGRISRQRLDEIRSGLSDRDLGVLRSLADYRLMNQKQIARIHFRAHATDKTAATVCRRVLSRLNRLGVVGRLERRIGGMRAGSAGYVYLLSQTGSRILSPGKRTKPYEPGLSHVRHRLAISELGTLVSAHVIDVGLESEVKPEPSSWRPWSDGYNNQVLKPDLAIRLGDEQREASWLVEIDLATESMPVIKDKCVAYMRYWQTGHTADHRGLFPRVLWVVPSVARASQVRRLLARDHGVLEPALFAVAVQDQALSVITDLRDDGT